MNFDPLSFIIGKHGNGAPIKDVISYLMGNALSDDWRTITDVSVASFTAVVSPLRELVISVEPIRSGSGDPSPDNIRPIGGHAGAHILVSPTLNQMDARIYGVDWFTEAGIIYKGTLNVTTGELTVLYSGAEFPDGFDFYGPSTSYSQTYVYFSRSIGSNIEPNDRFDITKAICDCLPSVSRDQVASGISGLFQYHVDNYNMLGFAFPRESRFATVSDVLNTLGWITVAYPLKTPFTYQLTPTEVMTLLGQNYVWVEVGNIETITYRAN